MNVFIDLKPESSETREVITLHESDRIWLEVIRKSVIHSFVFWPSSSRVQMRVFVTSGRRSDGTCRYSSCSIISYSSVNCVYKAKQTHIYLSNNFVSYDMPTSAVNQRKPECML